jgi:hypothetical protein
MRRPHRHLLQEVPPVVIISSQARQSNDTSDMQALLHGLAPITALPSLFMAVQSALLYNTVEFLCAASVVAAGKYLAQSPLEDATPFVPAVFAAAALAMFAYSAYHDKSDRNTSLYTLEHEDGDDEVTISLSDTASSP